MIQQQINTLPDFKLISHKYKFVYFVIAKVGSSSLKKYMKHIGGDMVVKAPLNKDLTGYKRFTTVRNPWDRIVSCYVDKKNRGMKILNKHKPKGKITFDKFIDIISKIPDEESDSHFKSQYATIFTPTEICQYDYIGRFENFENDISKMFGMCGLNDVTLPNPNIGKPKKPHYSTFYNDITKKLVENRYKKDIEYFNYDFDVI